MARGKLDGRVAWGCDAGLCAYGGKDTPVDSRVAAACSRLRIGARRGCMDILFPDEAMEFGTTARCALSALFGAAAADQ